MALNESSPIVVSRRPISGTVVVVLVLVAAGISVSATAAYFELRPGPASAGPGAVTVTDDLGRSVTAHAAPARLVVLSPNALDIVVRLGLRSHVVGVDCASVTGLASDYSSDQIAAWGLNASMCVPVSPSLDVEVLLHDAPGLVLASTIIALSDIEEVQNTYHIPVVVLAPADLGGIVLDVGIVADLYGMSSSASVRSSLTHALTAELDHAAAVDANLTNQGATLPAVLVTYYVYPVGSTLPGYYTYGPGTFGQSLVEIAGGTSISANATTAYPILTGPQVLFDNPSQIVYATGFGLDLSSYAAGPNWNQFSAVHAGHVTGIDSNLLTEADPTMILVGLPDLLGVLHPGL